jgi:hypothetical protein
MCPVAFKAAIDSFSTANAPQAVIVALATKCLLIYGEPGGNLIRDAAQGYRPGMHLKF